MLSMRSMQPDHETLDPSIVGFDDQGQTGDEAGGVDREDVDDAAEPEADPEADLEATIAMDPDDEAPDDRDEDDPMPPDDRDHA
jgi:hypothetical protein